MCSLLAFAGAEPLAFSLVFVALEVTRGSLVRTACTLKSGAGCARGLTGICTVRLPDTRMVEAESEAAMGVALPAVTLERFSQPIPRHCLSVITLSNWTALPLKNGADGDT
jgi:hypothetical protein